jgi:hypothetical protein
MGKLIDEIKKQVSPSVKTDVLETNSPVSQALTTNTEGSVSDWNVPVAVSKEPAGIDYDLLAAAIAKRLQTIKIEITDNRPGTPIQAHLYIDGREVGSSVAEQIELGHDRLITAVGKIV